MENNTFYRTDEDKALELICKATNVKYEDGDLEGNCEDAFNVIDFTMQELCDISTGDCCLNNRGELYVKLRDTSERNKFTLFLTNNNIRYEEFEDRQVYINAFDLVSFLESYLNPIKDIDKYSIEELQEAMNKKLVNQIAAELNIVVNFRDIKEWSTCYNEDILKYIKDKFYEDFKNEYWFAFQEE